MIVKCPRNSGIIQTMSHALFTSSLQDQVQQTQLLYISFPGEN